MLMEMQTNCIRDQWYQSCLQAGIPAIGMDKAAKILAMVYVLGGSHSSYTHSIGLRSTLDYIKKKFNIEGGETPDARILPLIKQYSKEIEDAFANAPESSNGIAKDWYPDWVTRIAEEYDLPTNDII